MPEAKLLPPIPPKAPRSVMWSMVPAKADCAKDRHNKLTKIEAPGVPIEVEDVIRLDISLLDHKIRLAGTDGPLTRLRPHEELGE